MAEQGCPMSPDICTEAAREGHLDVLKYARENGCPWDEGACSWAAHNGHHQVLQWLIENGCPFAPYDKAFYELLLQ